MNELMNDFHERLAEVEAYLEFLLMIEVRAQHGAPRLEGTDRPISAQQQRILYSSVYLQLYNLVESTMSGCIDAVTKATMQDKRWMPGDLSEALRREWVRKMACTHEEMNRENRLKSADKLCAHLVNKLPVAGFTLDKGGGGNWDDTAIEAISKRLGCQLNVSQPVYSAVKRQFKDDLGPLAFVKDLRNRLAHGSVSFAQCAEDITVNRLVELKNKTVDYLREVLKCFCAYLETFEYLLPERRPI